MMAKQIMTDYYAVFSFAIIECNLVKLDDFLLELCANKEQFSTASYKSFAPPNYYEVTMGPFSKIGIDNISKKYAKYADVMSINLTER